MIVDNQKQLPCGTCCDLDMSCCHNPQITWTIQEFDKLVTDRPDILEKVIVLKAELPGMIYILDKEVALNPDENNSIRLEYCAFYDTEAQNCGVYDYRPAVCSTYGDPQYNACPYEDMDDVELADMVRDDKIAAMKLHGTAFSDPVKFGNDFIEPFVTAFINSDPEYMKWWEGLPKSNFIRK